MLNHIHRIKILLFQCVFVNLYGFRPFSFVNCSLRFKLISLNFALNFSSSITFKGRGQAVGVSTGTKSLHHRPPRKSCFSISDAEDHKPSLLPWTNKSPRHLKEYKRCPRSQKGNILSGGIKPVNFTFSEMPSSPASFFMWGNKGPSPPSISSTGCLLQTLTKP